MCHLKSTKRCASPGVLGEFIIFVCILYSIASSLKTYYFETHSLSASFSKLLLATTCFRKGSLTSAKGNECFSFQTQPRTYLFFTVLWLLFQSLKVNKKGDWFLHSNCSFSPTAAKLFVRPERSDNGQETATAECFLLHMFFMHVKLTFYE